MRMNSMSSKNLRIKALSGAVLILYAVCLRPAAAAGQPGDTASATAPATASATPSSPASAPVVVSGTVADEAARAALLARLREVFGADRVVDQLGIGRVSAPVDWTGQVRKLIGPDLKHISAGQLTIEGGKVSVRGDVGSEARRREIGDGMAASLNASFTVDNALRVGAIDMGTRTVEFESGKAVLTPAGMRLLDEVVVLMRQRPDGKFKVVGHTDNAGFYDRNVALSLARAEAVKAYLVGKGMAAGAIAATGEGPDRPVADNASAAGRASNRRIEFLLAR